QHPSVYDRPFSSIIFSERRQQPRRPPLFPYTTLFRSIQTAQQAEHVVAAQAVMVGNDQQVPVAGADARVEDLHRAGTALAQQPRSEEHTSELQSREKLVCRLLHEKKKSMQSSGRLYCR